MNTARTVRLRISRRKGFDLQVHSRVINGLPAINCARPGRYGNPFDWTIMGRAPAIQRFIEEQIPVLEVEGALPLLRGHNLACWCGLDEPCHVDVLLRLANTDHFAGPGKMGEVS